MIKVSPTFSNGFDFVQISSLPFFQQNAFREWIPQSSLFKLTLNDITMTDCVFYQEYAYWFDSFFKKVDTLLDNSF